MPYSTLCLAPCCALCDFAGVMAQRGGKKERYHVEPQNRCTRCCPALWALGSFFYECL